MTPQEGQSPRPNLHHATFNKTLNSSPNNLSRRHQVHRHNSVKNCRANTNLNLSEPDDVLSTSPAVSWHGSVHRAGHQAQKLEKSDSDFGSIGLVIVHRNARDIDMCGRSQTAESHNFKSGSCECECCFLEENAVNVGSPHLWNLEKFFGREINI